MEFALQAKIFLLQINYFRIQIVLSWILLSESIILKLLNHESELFLCNVNRSQLFRSCSFEQFGALYQVSLPVVGFKQSHDRLVIQSPSFISQSVTLEPNQRFPHAHICFLLIRRRTVFFQYFALFLLAGIYERGWRGRISFTKASLSVGVCAVAQSREAVFCWESLLGKFRLQRSLGLLAVEDQSCSHRLMSSLLVYLFTCRVLMRSPRARHWSLDICKLLTGFNFRH